LTLNRMVNRMLRRLVMLVLIGALALAGGQGASAVQSERLRAASAANDVKEVRRLLNRGAPLHRPDGYGATPLFWAASRNAPDVVELLLQRGADPDVSGAGLPRPLLSAIERGAERVARLLVAAGASPHRIAGDAEDPLTLALRLRLKGPARLLERMRAKRLDSDAGALALGRHLRQRQSPGGGD